MTKAKAAQADDFELVQSNEEVVVSINGMEYFIPRGEDALVPTEVADVLRDAGFLGGPEED
jgi:hypothetical protein